MKRIFGLIIFIVTVFPGNAQQDPQFSQSMYNIMMFNPGYVGSKNAICATAVNRQQWVGFEGAPVSSLFTVNSPFRLFGADHGAGLHILNDEAGFETNLSINASYAFRMNLGNGKLGIGFGLGVINSSLDADWFVPAGEDFTTPSADPSIPAGNETVLTVDFSGGLFYYDGDLYVGISSTHINEPAVEYTQSARPFRSRHYYLTAGYRLPMKNPSVSALPAVLLQTDGAIAQLNIGAIIDYNSRLWGGLFYRHGAAIVGIAGVELFNGINIGYSYDFSTTAIMRHNKGSHEFMLRYCFDLDMDRTPQRYRSIRIL
ncbi:MAG: type IX secretion system membrane protein PorP/SprF [Marinilabiliales bacterium]|nr:MAG: type IX secretion system membrane protein PorP/SprF [Marinilabiliales bacterium]